MHSGTPQPTRLPLQLIRDRTPVPFSFEQEAAKKQCSAVYVFSAKGAAFNGQPGAAPQGSWTPTARALKARFTIGLLRRHGVISTSGMFWVGNHPPD